jgi:hypothetical protein
MISRPAFSFICRTGRGPSGRSSAQTRQRAISLSKDPSEGPWVSLGLCLLCRMTPSIRRTPLECAAKCSATTARTHCCLCRFRNPAKLSQWTWLSSEVCNPTISPSEVTRFPICLAFGVSDISDTGIALLNPEEPGGSVSGRKTLLACVIHDILASNHASVPANVVSPHRSWLNPLDSIVSEKRFVVGTVHRL